MHFRKLTKNARELIDKLFIYLDKYFPKIFVLLSFFIEMFGIDFQSFALLASRVLLLDLTKPLIMRVWWDYDLLLGKQVIANWIHFRKIRVSYHISPSSIKNYIEQWKILLCMELPKQMRIERMKVILPKSGKKHPLSLRLIMWIQACIEVLLSLAD